MAFNKQSNVYTIIYIVVLVVVVGAALALVAMSLKPLQKANEDADKMRQILASVHIVPGNGEIVADFDRYITSQTVVNYKGEVIGDDAFSVNVAAQSKIADVSKRELPVCKLKPQSVFLIKFDL